MNKVHEKLVELLKDIDGICRKYGITYYAAGGTVIGAVRHKGFIPWDDDADLYMTRDNFYKFREAVRNEKPEYRVLGCLDDNPEYPGTIPRYIDTTTSFIGKFNCLNTVEAGVTIDVFILDPVPSQKVEEYLGLLNIYADFVMPFYAYMTRMDEKYLELYDWYEKRMKEHGRSAVLRELENKIFSYKEEECDCFMLRWPTLPHIFEKEMFLEPVYFDYEDMKMPCPTKWYDYLVQLYGPGWVYVPEYIEDEGHSSIIDCDHKYTNYLIDAERFIPKEKARNDFYRRKNLLRKRTQLQRPFENEALLLKGRCQAAIVEKQLERKGYIDKKSFEGCSVGEITKLFERYLDVQLSLAFAGKLTHGGLYRLRHPIFVPIRDEYLEVILNALVLDGKIKQCGVILNMRKEIDALTPELESISRKNELIYQLLKEIFFKRFEEAERLLSLFDRKDIKESAQLQMLDFQINIGLGKENGERVEAIEKNEDAASEMLKIAGDYYYLKGELEKAKGLYKKSLENLTNGIMILDIKSKYNLEATYKKSEIIPKKTEYQEATMKLLSEIDEICKANAIKYFLFGRALYYAYFEGVLNDDKKTVSVVMKPEDAVRFIDVMKNNPVKNREIIYPVNSDLHRYHSIYYQMTNSVDMTFQNTETTKNRKIHVKIDILKRTSSKKAKYFATRTADYFNTINQEIAMGIKPLKAMSRKTQLYYNISHPFWKVFGGRKMSEKVFNNYIEMASGKSNKDYFLSKKNARQSVSRYYESSYFDDGETVKLYGKEFSAPGNLKVFMKEVFGKYSSNYIKVRRKEYNKYRIVETDAEYSDFADVIENSPNIDKLYEDYQKALIINRDLKEINTITSYYWNILLCAEARFKMYIQYSPEKDHIIALFNDENYSELERVLSDYDMLAREQIRKGFALCFDKEIFDIYCKMLVNGGETQFAQELRDNVRPEHLLPIEILY